MLGIWAAEFAAEFAQGRWPTTGSKPRMITFQPDPCCERGLYYY